jgi:hypothetical protein
MTTEGYNTDTRKIPVSVETVCGPESTVLTWPTVNGFLDNLYKAPFTSPVLDIVGTFTSANV